MSVAGKTFDIIKKILDIDNNMAIIATDGKTDVTIQLAIESGASAISYCPPTTAELFKDIMTKHREE